MSVSNRIVPPSDTNCPAFGILRGAGLARSGLALNPSRCPPFLSLAPPPTLSASLSLHHYRRMCVHVHSCVPGTSQHIFTWHMKLNDCCSGRHVCAARSCTQADGRTIIELSDSLGKL